MVQPQTIKINQPDAAASGGQAASKSACCGSWEESVSALQQEVAGSTVAPVDLGAKVILMTL